MYILFLFRVWTWNNHPVSVALGCQVCENDFHTIFGCCCCCSMALGPEQCSGAWLTCRGTWMCVCSSDQVLIFCAFAYTQISIRSKIRGFRFLLAARITVGHLELVFRSIQKMSWIRVSVCVLCEALQTYVSCFTAAHAHKRSLTRILAMPAVAMTMSIDRLDHIYFMWSTIKIVFITKH